MTLRRARFITFEDFQPSIKHIRDVGVSVGWYLTLKSVSDPCQSTNRKRTFEINSFRTISCGIGTELSFWQRRTGGFKCFSDYARDTIKHDNFGYKWTITCVLVVRNTQKGTTIRTVITINVVKTVVKYGVISRDPHVSHIQGETVGDSQCKTPLRVCNSHFCARTHTSMRVLLRHSRHSYSRCVC